MDISALLGVLGANPQTAPPVTTPPPPPPPMANEPPHAAYYPQGPFPMAPPPQAYPQYPTSMMAGPTTTYHQPMYPAQGGMQQPLPVTQMPPTPAFMGATPMRQPTIPLTDRSAFVHQPYRQPAHPVETIPVQFGGAVLPSFPQFSYQQHQPQPQLTPLPTYQPHPVADHPPVFTVHHAAQPTTSPSAIHTFTPAPPRAPTPAAPTPAFPLHFVDVSSGCVTHVQLGGNQSFTPAPTRSEPLMMPGPITTNISGGGYPLSAGSSAAPVPLPTQSAMAPTAPSFVPSVPIPTLHQHHSHSQYQLPQMQQPQANLPVSVVSAKPPVPLSCPSDLPPPLVPLSPSRAQPSLSQANRCCDLCAVTTDPLHFEQHVQGKNHLRKMRYLLKRSVVLMGAPAVIPLPALIEFFSGISIDEAACQSKILQEAANGQCQLVVFMSEGDTFRAKEFSGRLFGNQFPLKVKRALEAWTCEICETTSNSASQFEQHIQSRRHMLKFRAQCSVEVRGLGIRATEAELKAHFANALGGSATVKMVNLSPSPLSTPPSQISPTASPPATTFRGRVLLDSQTSARRAVALLHGQPFQDRPLTVTLVPRSEPRANLMTTPGGETFSRSPSQSASSFSGNSDQSDPAGPPTGSALLSALNNAQQGTE